MSSPRRACAILAAASIILLASVAVLHVPHAAADNPGDWPMGRHDPGNSGYNSTEATLRPPFRQKWRDQFLHSHIFSPPVVAENSVLVEFGGYLSAIDTTTGTIRWRYQIGYTSSSNPVVGDNGVVYVVSGNLQRDLSALDAQTGALLWRYTSGFNYSPVAAGSTVYVHGWLDGGYQLQAVDGSTGAPRWAYPLGQDGYAAASPAMADGIVFASAYSFSNGNRTTLYALDAKTGALRWSYVADTAQASGVAPVAVGGTVYLVGSNAVYAINGQTGELKWTSTPGGKYLYAPAVTNGALYVSSSGDYCGDGNLYALDTSTGSLRWTRTVGGCTAPVAANGLVYARDLLGRDSYILALDSATGEQRGTFGAPADGVALTSMAIAKGTLYAVGSIGYSYYSPGTAVLYAVESDVSIPGLSVINIATRDRVLPGDALNYLISLDNRNDTSISVALTDTIPAGTSLVTGTVTGGAVYSPTINSILWSGTVPSGSSATPTAALGFRVSVSSAITSNLVLNTATVSNGAITVTDTAITAVRWRSLLPSLPEGPVLGW